MRGCVKSRITSADAPDLVLDLGGGAGRGVAAGAAGAAGVEEDGARGVVVGHGERLGELRACPGRGPLAKEEVALITR